MGSGQPPLSQLITEQVNNYDTSATALAFSLGRPVPRVNMHNKTNLFILSGRLVIFMNLALSLACGAFVDVSLTPVLTAVQGIILIQGETGIGNLVHPLKSPLNDVECVVVTTAAIAVRTVNHADLFSAHRTVVCIMSGTYRAIHDNVSLRTDQQTHAMNPAKAEIDAVSRSPSTMPTQTSARASRAKMPAKTDSRRLPQKPMTLRKVLDTIDSILLKNLSVVKLDDVDTLVSAIGRVLVKSELQTSLLICRDGRP